MAVIIVLKLLMSFEENSLVSEPYDNIGIQLEKSNFMRTNSSGFRRTDRIEFTALKSVYYQSSVQ